MTNPGRHADSLLLPIYLGPILPRWQPRSVADVQAAIDDGTLAERHWLDVKESVGTSDGAKKELARDLASFANDGGGYIIGVAEDKSTGKLTLAQVELAGLPERIDQVARSRCDPPLYVVCHPLPSDTDPTRGVLLVEIPPSPLAPHMVDGTYHGRGDKTKHKLTDAEVANLHARRSSRQLTGEQVIAREVARCPIELADQEFSHLYVVAQPLASPPDLVTSLIERPYELRSIINEVDRGVFDSRDFAPNLSYATECEPRPRGAGFFTPEMVGRKYVRKEGERSRERSQLDLEVGDDGTITLFMGGASKEGPHTSQQFVLVKPVVVLTRIIVSLAGRLGGDAGYAGRWLMAAGLTNLRGRYGASQLADILRQGEYPPYSEDTYVQATECVTAELLSRPGAVTTRLLHRLLRALGESTNGFDQWLVDA